MDSEFVSYGSTLDVIRLWMTSPLRLYATRPPSTGLKQFIVDKMLPAMLPQSSGGLLVSLPGGGRVSMKYGEEIARLLLLHGAYEAAELTMVRHLAAPGSTAIDVGANIGMYTVALATAVGREGAVLAFEPVPQTSERLRANLSLNELTNVEVVAAAAGASRGIADIRLANDSAYASIVNVKKGRGTGKIISVRIVTLDETWEEQGRPVVSFCKIDVEGAELSVLEGAARMLAACRPALLLEADQGAELDALTSWLQPRGYRERASPGFMPWNHLFVSR
jgi:FkbM family methyltransferase